jgi:hypothetical protein
MVVLTATAQNKRYLLVEYMKLRPGITDSNSVIENTRERIQQQQEKDKSVLSSAIWEVVNYSHTNNEYQYVVTTVFNNFNDYMAEYKNRDSNMFYSVSKDRFDTVTLNKNDSFKVVYAEIFEILAQTKTSKQLPQFLLNTDIKATSGREMAYESLVMSDWLPIHEDLIKKGYENSFNFSKLVFPERVGLSYNYCTFLYFNDEEMFDKQNDIDWEPYMRANQSAFVNSGKLRTEVHSELLKLVTVLDNGKK